MSTYSQIYIQIVFAVKGRESLISETWDVELYKYITGIINNSASKLYAIYANPEHVHFLVSRSPKISEEALLKKAAENSQQFIIENKLSSGNFSWQETASAFSVSKGEVDKVCKYILNQPEHHKKSTFQQEYDEFIKFYQKTLKWEIS